MGLIYKTGPPKDDNWFISHLKSMRDTAMDLGPTALISPQYTAANVISGGKVEDGVGWVKNKVTNAVIKPTYNYLNSASGGYVGDIVEGVGKLKKKVL